MVFDRHPQRQARRIGSGIGTGRFARQSPPEGSSSSTRTSPGMARSREKAKSTSQPQEPMTFGEFATQLVANIEDGFATKSIDSNGATRSQPTLAQCSTSPPQMSLRRPYCRCSSRFGSVNLKLRQGFAVASNACSTPLRSRAPRRREPGPRPRAPRSPFRTRQDRSQAPRRTPVHSGRRVHGQAALARCSRCWASRVCHFTAACSGEVRGMTGKRSISRRQHGRCRAIA